MNIALAGFGQEGRASYDYWNTAGNALTIADERESVDGLPEGAQTILGDGAFSQLSDFDLIIRSPSVNPKKLPYGEKVWSATNEFFAHCPAPIIGVTGTKGKGTTSSLIASILTAAGKTVHLVGNIGTPALLELPNITQDDIVVFEISSFQLWDIKKSPHVAVVLMIEPDHLDTHDDMDDYVNAKTNIVRFQTQDDVVVFNKNNQISVQIAAQSAGKQIEYPFDLGEIAESIVLPGPHNVENTAAAVADSYSSAPGASIAALKSFIDPKIIILGGYDKHADFSELAGYVAHDATIKKAILIGQTKQRIADEFAKLGIGDERYELIADSTFSDIIRHASEIAVPGDVILLSPGCASFDMFKNFTDRGEQFVQIVNTL
jgi:UDP-N-acetylmuramoylalanine--D-glutamate ligase